MKLANLLVTNFSGGKRHLASRDGGKAALDELARDIEGLRGGRISAIAAIQEMTSFEPTLPLEASDLERRLGQRSRSTFIPRVSTSWYPLTKKWDSDVNADHAQTEGLCLASVGADLELLPWSTLGGPRSVESLSRVLDLPAFEFPDRRRTDESVSDSDWLRTVRIIRQEKHELLFRPAYYRGSRDTDPRVAQACILGSSNRSKALSVPLLIFINVHLSTLSMEYDQGVTGRVFRPEASFLREVQLNLIARFIDEARSMYGLPVVVAGDFNANPDSPELLGFARRSGLVPLLTSGACWRCHHVQFPREEVAVWAAGDDNALSILHPANDTDPAFYSDLFCSNPMCMEPRFTHKGNRMLLDNVFLEPAMHDLAFESGATRVSLLSNYSDHASITCPIYLD